MLAGTRRAWLTWLWLWASASVPGCTCGDLDGDEGPVEYTRCSNADPPERELTLAGLTLRTEDRVLHVEAPRPLRLAAFTGPLGGALDDAAVADLMAVQPHLILFTGGVGQDEATARANLEAAATPGVPVLVLGGGADRLSVMEDALDALEAPLSQRVLHANGLREIRIGNDSFAVLPGAALGRYALDEDSCGFGPEDTEQLAEHFADRDKGGDRVWLWSWGAPSGWGVSSGMGGMEIGSVDLQTLAERLKAEGGLFAHPEAQAGRPAGKADTALRMVVPRLGPMGSGRADRSRLPRGLAVAQLDGEGLGLAPPRPEAARADAER